MERTHEMGTRRALGASATDIFFSGDVRDGRAGAGRRIRWNS
jgi:hypothetical protein